MRQAKEFIYHANYDNALAVLTSSKQLSRNDKEGRFLIAVCYYQLNDLDKALTSLTQQVEEERSPYPESWLYLGKIYHAQNRFDEASRYYKLYLKTIRPDHPHRNMVREEIRRAANGLELQYHEQLAVVENLGPGVNTSGDEFAPVLSPNFVDKIYFSSIRQGNTGGARNEHGRPDDRLGHFFSDMFSCQITANGWGATTPLHYLLNSPKNEVLLDFNGDGSVLFYFKSWSLINGDIVIDTFKTVETRTLSSTPLQSQLNSNIGDDGLYLYNDTLMFFASRRAGGYGGYDLYRSSLVNGRWTPAENLGPDVNSPFDESTPFLSRDGITLYFSSNNSHLSIGGFDVFKSVYNGRSNRWTTPFNLGLPINSSSDDTHFRISRDGFSAFFASSRKDGFGQRDLYVAYFENFLPEMEPPQIVYYEPEITPEQQPISVATPPADFDTPTFNNEDTFQASTIPEPPVIITEPKVTKPAGFKALNFNDVSEVVTQGQETLDRTAQILLQNPNLNLVFTAYTHGDSPLTNRLFDAITAAENASKYLLNRGVSAKQIFMRALKGNASSNPKLGLEFGFTNTLDLSNPSAVPVIGDGYQSLVLGLTTNQALCYKVQIASLKGSFSNQALNNYPNAMVEKVPDFDYYRYTLGAFTTYAEAYAFRRQILSAGFSGAYVVPYLYGRRADKYEVKRSVGLFPDLRKYLGE
ncbi:MAG: hypothetical protein DHS20C18_00810 [Saprospiraceae bacterium]|nr:MAG: hypothetical protein DHS20C18_00810 [Saprospiraceae bacterium]